MKHFPHINPRHQKSFGLIVFIGLTPWLLLVMGFLSSDQSLLAPPEIEICDNAIDDDGDGLIDINDPDCECTIVSPESIIPNHSFEEYHNCPSGYSRMEDVKDWIDASGATPDYMHSCGYNIGEQMGLTPYPDGDAAVLFIDTQFTEDDGTAVPAKEYVGVCLKTPMKKGTEYKLIFHIGFPRNPPSSTVNFSFFGSPSCSNLPFSSISDFSIDRVLRHGCPANFPDWHLVSSQVVSIDPDESPAWKEVTMTIKPEMDINAIVPGTDCSLNTTGVFLMDDFVLDETSDFDFELLDIGNPCDPDYAFGIVRSRNANISYQWYKEGIALIGETSNELSKMYGEGIYQLRTINAGTGECRRSADYLFSKPFTEHYIHETICEGGSYFLHGDTLWDEGTYTTALTAVDGCDSVIILDLRINPSNVDTVRILTLPSTLYRIEDQEFDTEGEYQVSLATPEGCDSAVVLFLSHVDIFIPNVFSPNGDDINDYFEIESSSQDAIHSEVSIFNRWGDLVYKGKKWDGTIRGKKASPGVFFYQIWVKDSYGGSATYKSSLTLLR